MSDVDYHVGKNVVAIIQWELSMSIIDTIYKVKGIYRLCAYPEPEFALPGRSVSNAWRVIRVPRTGFAFSCLS